MEITKETVTHIANLAKIKLTDAETNRLAAEMAKIVGFADKLAELEIAGVEPTTHAVKVQNVLRDDVLSLPTHGKEFWPMRRSGTKPASLYRRWWNRW